MTMKEALDAGSRHPETPVEIKPFSKDALEFLKEKGLLHYRLDGQSLRAQKLAGRPFWYIYMMVKESYLYLQCKAR
ncbi:MAG: hypothetical protein HYW62_04130 [Candidatus Levybacteria bacterium]|nr:hypothetical protein [Candidatus Levybacteria bacterium]